MELDLQSLFRLHVRAKLYSLAETPQLPSPPPAFKLIYEGAIGQKRLTTYLLEAGGQTKRPSKT